MHSTIHGRNLIIKLDGEVIAAMKSCDIEVSGEAIEIASPTSAAWKEFISGRKSWNISSNYLVTHGIMLSSLNLINKVVSISFMYCENNLHTSDGVTLSGSAIIQSWKVSADTGSIAKGSFSFLGSGPLTMTDNYTYLVPDGNDGMVDSNSEKIIVRKYNQ